MVPSGQRIEKLVLQRKQVHVGDRLRALYRLALPVEREAAVPRAADKHLRAAALEREQQLALQEEERAAALLVLQRIAAAGHALDPRELGQLTEARRRQPGERRERRQLLGRRVGALH